MVGEIFDPFLKQNGIVILDGALSTELEKRGADLKHELWSANLLTENPALIREVHLDYLKAGAQVITTASYQASFGGFEKQGFDRERAVALMRLSTTLAIEARDEAVKLKHLSVPKPLIAASIGPYGASLADGSEYRGNYGLSVEELMLFHRERMKTLSESGADLLALETIPCPQEAIALIRLLKEFPATKAWISFSCKNETQVSDGSNFAESVALANNSEQVLAVGVNCTAPQFVEPLVRIAKKVSKKLILAYPNQGDTWDAQKKYWLPSGRDTDFINDAILWYNAGASLIGGCCRTSPSDIQKLSRAFRPS